MELRDQTSEMATLRFLLQIYTNYYNFVNTEGQKNIFPFIGQRCSRGQKTEKI